MKSVRHRYILTDKTGQIYEFEKGKDLAEFYQNSLCDWSVFDKMKHETMTFLEFIVRRKENLSKRGRKYKNGAVRSVNISAKVTKNTASLLEDKLRKNGISLGDFIELALNDADRLISKLV